MGRAKKIERTRSDELWDEYQAIQLTPEQKAQLRAETAKLGEEARREGVYQKIIALRGKVHLDMDDIREVRKSKR